MHQGAGYPVPKAVAKAETLVQRSRFIAQLSHAPDAEKARTFVAHVRQQFPDATHHCWAFLCGPPGDTRVVGMSDDGEPHGTAGRPMLQVLLHSGVGQIVAVVTRYFGGRKLGTGGLVRAYSQAVQSALTKLQTEQAVSYQALSLEIPYHHIDLFKMLCERYQVQVDQESFSETVAVVVRIPVPAWNVFLTELRGQTQGRVIVP